MQSEEQDLKLNQLLEGKNPKQKEAIVSLNGPVMIVAGAGSGKTTVLINRTANLLNKGVSPSSILLITFTNKAASEIKERLRESVGERADYINVGTFHSMFIEHILKKYKDHEYFSEYGVDMERFSIIDDKDSEKLYKDAYDMLPPEVREYIEGSSYTTSMMTSEISIQKSRGVDVSEYARSFGSQDSASNFKKAVALLWNNYKGLCVDLNGFDFDDILVVCAQLMERDPKVSMELASKFKFIMVDEYQDTNGVQKKITDAIAVHHGNICVVGDEKQSIYGFRGSDISVILSFEKRYKDVKKIDMSMNYRSQKRIISASNGVADAMNQRLTDGALTAMSDADEVPVRVVEFGSDLDESSMIVRSIQRDLSNGVPGSEIAVIYRNKAIKAELEKGLVASQVPYRLIGDTSFYQRAEVKDAIAMIRFIFRPWDSMAGLRVLGATSFGVSGKGARDAMKKDKLPIYQYLCQKSESKLQSGAPSAVGRKAKAFVDALDSIKILQEVGAKADIVTECLEDLWEIYLRPKITSSAKKSANKDAASNFESKVENVTHVFSQFKDAYAESGDIDKVIEDLILKVESRPEMDRDRHAKIQLMTIHASKGLEFGTVYLMGMDEQTLPGKPIKEFNMTDQSDIAEIEESRRLLYVGMTRAKLKLVMSYSKHRRQHGNFINTEISPFITEAIKRDKTIEVVTVPTSNFGHKKSYQRSDVQRSYSG